MSPAEEPTAGYERVDEHLALLVHELRAPLTVLVGYLEILKRDLPPADRDAIIATMQRAAERMNDMLEGVLHGHDLWVAPDPAAFAPVPLRELANEVSEDFRATAPQDIVVQADDDGFVLGDRSLLERLLANLVGNAVKYSDDESVVKVSVEAGDGVVRLTVADTGPGIPAEDRERVFGKFVRLQRDEDHPGLGLGLSIAADVIAAHNGKVRIETCEPTGTAFVVDFPASSERPWDAESDPIA